MEREPTYSVCIVNRTDQNKSVLEKKQWYMQKFNQLHFKGEEEIKPDAA